jgi:putative aldouronate transport system permease protein
VKKFSRRNIFNLLIISGFILFSIICIYPFIYVTALAFNDGIDAMKGGIYFLPRKFTLQNFITIFNDERLLGSTMVSIYRTVLGAAFSVILNSCFAFALSKKDIPGRKFLSWYILIPMYFSGGLIPYFLVCKQLNLVNNILVYLLPWLIMPFYILLLKVYYTGMPESMEESAMIDGAGYFTIFFKLYFPLSAPALATIALLSGIIHWNDWLDGTIMVSNSRIWPLQTLLLNIVQGSDMIKLLFKNANNGMVNNRVKITYESVKMAILVFTVAPIAIVYPFLQKYFVKGIMLGSIKG